MSADGGNGRLWRIVFLGEIIVLTAPILVPMVLIALIGAIYCSCTTLVSVIMLIAGGDEMRKEATLLFPLGSCGTFLCLCGLLAANKFRKVSMVYLFEPIESFRGCRQDFRLCLALAAAPLILTAGIAAASISSAETQAWGVFPFVSGAVLLIPLAHLWLALRETERSGGSEAPALVTSNLVGAR